MTSNFDDPNADFDLRTFIVPRQSWVFEVDSFTFDTLADAVSFSERTGAPIYCRPKVAKKAASW